MMDKFCEECGNKLGKGSKFCGECGAEIGNTEVINHNKREKVLGGKKSKSQWINMLLVAGFAGIIFIYFSTTNTAEEKVINNQPTVTSSFSYPSSNTRMTNVVAEVKDGNIILPIEVVRKNKFVSFEYNGKNIRVPLLAYISEDGTLVTAIRMCEPCNSKSFHIKGSTLVCDACGTTWKLNDLEAIQGGCAKYPPEPIPSEIEGDQIIISEKAVSNWTRRV